MAALTILDLTKVNVAVPSIQAAFEASSTHLQLIVSGYVLAFGLVLVPAGRLGDQRSRKALFIVGLSLFLVASVACALAPSATALMISRIVQGAAAGLQMPQVLGLIQQLFTGAERGSAFGLFGATIGVATAFGPTLGGLLIAIGGEADGWRLIFWMNVPLSLLVIVLAAWLLPGARGRSQRRLELDPVGVLLFALTVLAFLWPFLFTTGSPNDDPRRWWLLGAALLLLSALIWWERHYAARSRLPLMPFRMFRTISFRNGVLLSTTVFASLSGMLIVTTLFLQEGLALSPVVSGMVLIGFAVAEAISSWIGGLLVARIGRKLVVAGLLGLVLSEAGIVAAAVLAAPAAAIWFMACALTCGGVFVGIVLAPNQTLMLGEIAPHEGGLAGSIGQLGQRIGTAVGSAVALALFYASINGANGDGSDGAAYPGAYTAGMIASLVFVSLAALVGAVDLIRHRTAVPQQFPPLRNLVVGSRANE
ncbi:MFS transporter [Microbacterium atlanticum]|uniref:MFS transporter n=1 Tax=Microbacterium atlanticum TaxID=2782168 RepID=UPI0030804060